MISEKKDFDAAAASWDEKPERVKLAGEVAEAIIRQVAPTQAMKTGDFGCGTGLVTLALRPLVASITGIDSSPGMLAILKAKIAKDKLTNIDTRLLDVEKGEALTGEFDLLTSSMTLHHMRDPQALLRQFGAALVPGGILAIADLDPDGDQFHDDHTGVFHGGFERTALRAMFAEAGFDDIRDSKAAEIIKTAPDGSKRAFSVFLVSGRKR